MVRKPSRNMVTVIKSGAANKEVVLSDAGLKILRALSKKSAFGEKINNSELAKSTGYCLGSVINGTQELRKSLGSEIKFPRGGRQAIDGRKPLVSLLPMSREEINTWNEKVALERARGLVGKKLSPLEEKVIGAFKKLDAKGCISINLISEETGINPSTVGMCIFRIREKTGKELKLPHLQESRRKSRVSQTNLPTEITGRLELTEKAISIPSLSLEKKPVEPKPAPTPQKAAAAQTPAVDPLRNERLSRITALEKKLVGTGGKALDGQAHADRVELFKLCKEAGVRPSPVVMDYDTIRSEALLTNDDTRRKQLTDEMAKRDRLSRVK